MCSCRRVGRMCFGVKTDVFVLPSSLVHIAMDSICLWLQHTSFLLFKII